MYIKILNEDASMACFSLFWDLGWLAKSKFIMGQL